VTWTATASGTAKICTAWNASTASCTAWASSLSGTGPITDTSPLRWHGPAITTDPSATVTVEFHGAIGATTAPGTYPNTAAVATSRLGGPQEDDLSNNQDTAEITVLPGWSLAKSASPASGSVVHAGDTITYTVNATALAAAPAGTVTGTTVKDSLAEVADYADFVAGSVTVNGIAPAAPVTVTEPSAANGQTLTLTGLDLPGGTTVPITVKDPVAFNTSFRNYVLGEKTGNPPVQCAADTETDYLTHCSTQHFTPAVLQVLKVGENTAGTVVPFDGSEWGIYPDVAGAPGATAVAQLGPAPKTPAIGTGLFQLALDPGDYWLQEEKALDGFSLLPSPVAFTVAADGSVSLASGNTAALAACAPAATGSLCDLVPAAPPANAAAPTIVVLDIPVLDLPEAGGSTPPWAFFAAGAGLLVLTSAVATLIFFRRRRRIDDE
jgi:hypothetical protein